jgi:2-polyprenyl-6-hydroxyphenyl methylase/3-demethylubiquinone-9 3-methyltransferase
MSQHTLEVSTGNRFAFGRNWARFSRRLDAGRIAAAERSLREMLGVDRLQDCRFLDAGSGSGLFSLAAYRLGARVRSFDFDPDSVACTRSLRDRVDTLGSHDVVYSWGVLHHTGDMWRALDAIAAPVAPGGLLFISIYNDQGAWSSFWPRIKRLYNRRAWSRPLLIVLFLPYLIGLPWLGRRLRGRREGRRGMDLWFDMIDWLGGYPFEVARPDDIIAFYRERGFAPEASRIFRRGHGCNEFVFRRSAA